MSNTSLAEIEKTTEAFAEERHNLKLVVEKLQKEIQEVKDRHMSAIRNRVKRVAERHSELKALVESAPDNFVKPRTVVFHGVKVGFQKGKGGIEIVDADRTVELIKKVFISNSPDYLIVSESPDKKALEKLPVHDLKKVGCNVVAAEDQVVIKPVDGEVEKAVAALIKDATEEAA